MINILFNIYSLIIHHPHLANRLLKILTMVYLIYLFYTHQFIPHLVDQFIELIYNKHIIGTLLTNISAILVHMLLAKHIESSFILS